MRAATIRADRARRRQTSSVRWSFKTDPLTRRLIRPVLVAVMSTSLATALLVIATISTPEYRWYWLVPYVFMMSLMGAYTAAWLSNPQSRAVDKTLYRLSEIILIVTLARIISWLLFAGFVPSVDELRLFVRDPLSFFLAGGFLSTTLIAIVAWWFAGSLSALFFQLDVSEAELGYYTLPTPVQKTLADDQPIQIPRQALQDAYLRYFLGGGLVMIVLAALSTFEVNQFATVANPLAIARLGLQPVMLLALLGYVLTGIWLLSHARLLRLNARWLMDGVAMEPSFERNWQRTSLLWLTLIAIIAAFIPIGNTLPISRVLGAIVNGLFYVINLLVTYVGYLFGSLLLALQTTAGDEPLQAAPPFVPPSAPPPVEPPATPPVIGLVLSSALWTLLIAAVIGALLFVVRERGYNVGWERAQDSARQFRAWVLALWTSIHLRFRRARRTIPARLRAMRPESSPAAPASTPHRRYVRLGGLSPRDQIRYFYLSAVKRAGQRGVPRPASDTPREYAATLKQNWPDMEADVDELTGAFLEARYSPADIPPEAANSVKAGWRKLRGALRGRSTTAGGSGSS